MLVSKQSASRLCVQCVLVFPSALFVYNAIHNALFYRWHALGMYDQPRMRDPIMASLDTEYNVNAEMSHITCSVYLLVLAIDALLKNEENTETKLSFSFTRLGTAFFFANLLRFVTLTSTLLPASQTHCVAHAVGGTYNPLDAPRSIRDILLHMNLTKSCGDVLFSGCIVAATCLLLIIENMRTSKLNVYSARIVMSLYALLTVSCRKTYTMDVVLSFYTTFLVWNAVGVIYKKNKPIKLLDEV